MVPRRGRGRDRGHDFGEQGCGYVGGERSSYGGKQSASEKGLRQCRHCGHNNHISEKCWEKISRPEWVQLSDSDPPATCGNP